VRQFCGFSKNGAKTVVDRVRGNLRIFFNGICEAEKSERSWESCGKFREKVEKKNFEKIKIKNNFQKMLLLKMH
jgi:hypothetical protein